MITTLKRIIGFPAPSKPSIPIITMTLEEFFKNRDHDKISDYISYMHSMDMYFLLMDIFNMKEKYEGIPRHFVTGGENQT